MKRLWLLGGLVLVAAGCGGSVSTLSVPNPPAVTVTTSPPPLTLPPGLDNVSEGQVAGSTTTTPPAIGPGGAALNGTVMGPGGPVGGATVEVDRFVGDSYASARATTAADGTWTVANILGGRYRVRAWQTPSLAMAQPQVVFLKGDQRLSVPLQVTSYQGPDVSVAINPPTPILDQPTNLLVQVTNPTVGSDGVVRNPPVPGAVVTLVEGPNWTVANGNPQSTNGNGQVLFEVACTSLGSDALSAQVGTGAPIALQMPACSPPPTTTTAPPTTYQYQTTTSCPPNSTTTTTTPFGIGGGSTTSTTLAYGSQC